MFIILGRNEIPIYEVNLSTVRKETNTVYQFILHAALDIINEEAPFNSAMYLKSIDRYNELVVSAFVTAANFKLILLHDFKNDEGIGNFFKEVYDLLLKSMLNPFFDLGHLP